MNLIRYMKLSQLHFYKTKLKEARHKKNDVTKIKYLRIIINNTAEI